MLATTRRNFFLDGYASWGRSEVHYRGWSSDLGALFFELAFQIFKGAGYPYLAGETAHQQEILFVRGVAICKVADAI